MILELVLLRLPRQIGVYSNIHIVTAYEIEDMIQASYDLVAAKLPRAQREDLGI